MPVARKGRKGRLTLVHPTFGDENVLVTTKNKSDEAPEINITTTESPVPGEAEYDDEGGVPNRELSFTVQLREGQPQRYFPGESYDFKNYIGSKDVLDAETGRIFIRQCQTSGEDAQGDSVITLEYTCRVSNWVKAPRAIEALV